MSATEGFLTDREETAGTIDSLRTPVPNISGATTVTVPFWVVGVRKNGREEIRVHPILDRGNPKESPNRATPYVDYLRAHPTHSYTDMVDAVNEYVVRDEVRDALAGQDRQFADPSFLRRNDAVADRFVDALAEFELNDRPVNGDDGRSRTESHSEKTREEVVANA
jgi:hypothetical protein